LTPARFVERNDQIFFLGFEVGGRIIEGEMSVLPDSNESDVDRGLPQFLAGATNNFGRISLTVQQMVLSDSGFLDQALLKIIAEKSRLHSLTLACWPEPEAVQKRASGKLVSSQA